MAGAVSETGGAVIQRARSSDYPPLEASAFSNTLLRPSLHQGNFAAAFGARPTSNEIRFYLMLIIGVILMNHIYGNGRRTWLGNKFANFL